VPRNRKLIVLVIVFAVLSCARKTGGESGEPGRNDAQPEVSPLVEPSQSPSASASKPRKLALLVGINNYKYSDKISPLAGSINDVEDMKQVLIGKEFPTENILTLTDSQATHAAIINAIQTHLIGKAKQGDIVVFHYSGHGSTTRDVTGQMISAQDQTIVPYDSRGGNVFDISGAELHPLLLELAQKTKNLTFVLDSCHSGTLVRGARVRSVAPDTRNPPPLPEYAVAATRALKASGTESSPKFVAIAAATSRENAFEYVAEGKEHGALTYFLTRELRNAKPNVTYRDIGDKVRNSVSAQFPNQTPTVTGADADQYIFGDAAGTGRVYALASPSLLASNRVTLGIGQVHGATVGSIYEIYPPGSKKLGPPEKPLARVRLNSVGALSSEGAFVSGSSIPQASRAIEKEHQFSRLRMRVFLDGVENSPTLQSIRGQLQALNSIEIVDQPWSCNIQLRETGGKIQTLSSDVTTLSTPVPTNQQDAVDRVTGQVKLWAKWFNILSIRNPQSDIELQFTINEGQARDPMARIGKPDVAVSEGDKVEATLTNNAERDVYIAILDLSSDGSVSVIYPTDSAAMAVLKPGLKLSRTFTAFVPKGRSTVTDVIKAFASFKPIDLRPLSQASIREIDQETSDPLQALLNESANETRGLSSSLTKPADLGTWMTEQRVVRVKRR
jgi:Caspase domain